MTLILKKPTGAKLNLRKTWQPMDPDAAAYITAVETADGQALEERVKIAIDNFVRGCKADGIWSAIKASCILAGARTLSGALVPLVGTAPTNNNFVSGDYNRKTGLVGDGSTKYLNTNTPYNVAPLNNVHASVFASTIHTAGTRVYIRGAISNNATGILRDTSTGPETWVAHDVGSGVPRFGLDTATGFKAVRRNNSANYDRRTGGTTTNVTRIASTTAPTDTSNWTIFANAVPNSFSDARLAFYSIGESLDLALLDARVTDLINAFGAAIP